MEYYRNTGSIGPLAHYRIRANLDLCCTNTPHSGAMHVCQ